MRQRLYRLIKETVRFFYPKMTLEGLERLPQEGCVLVGNHSQLHGPVTAELFFPANHRTWCAMEMMNRALVPAYAYRDFWSAKPRWQRPFWKALAHLIAPLAELLFNEAGCIAVYRDLRVTETLRETRDALAAGQYVVIFPEKPEEYNEILHGFQEGFVDVARLCHRSTGRALRFVPFYVCPALKRVLFGEPVVFDPAAPYREERGRITAACMDEITRLARSLPRHRVVPYPNVPKREYPFSK